MMYPRATTRKEHDPDLQRGDVVRHRTTGEEGVVVGQPTRTQVSVQTTPGKTVLWYTANVKVR